MLLITILCLLVLYLPLPADRVRALPWLTTVGGVTFLTLMNVAGFLLMGVFAAARRVHGERAALSYLRFFKLYRLLILVFILIDVFVLKWPQFIQGVFSPESGWGKVPLIDDLILVSPLVVMLVGALVSQYQMDRAQRRMGLSLGRYIAMRFRIEEGIILFPWLLFVLVSDVLEILWGGSRYAELAGTIAVACLLVGFVLFGPVLLTKIWDTVRLPDGPLRRRLADFCGQTGFRYRDLLLWRTEKHLGNAAVTGVLPRWRYVILSDVLIDHCSEEEVRAIVAHEIAHIKFHHLRFYLFFAMGYLFFFTNLQDFAALMFPRLFRRPDSLINPGMGLAESILLVVFSIVYWGGIFGYISRRLELQADLYSAATTSPVIFASALRQLALLSGIPYKAGGWRHFSIARRVKLLGLTGDRDKMREVALSISSLKLAFFMFLIAAAARVFVFRPEILR